MTSWHQACDDSSLLCNHDPWTAGLPQDKQTDTVRSWMKENCGCQERNGQWEWGLTDSDGQWWSCDLAPTDVVGGASGKNMWKHRHHPFCVSGEKTDVKTNCSDKKKDSGPDADGNCYKKLWKVRPNAPTPGMDIDPCDVDKMLGNGKKCGEKEEYTPFSEIDNEEKKPNVPTPPAPMEERDNIWIIVGVILGVLIIFGLIFYFTRRQVQTQVPAAAMPAL